MNPNQSETKFSIGAPIDPNRIWIQGRNYSDWFWLILIENSVYVYMYMSTDYFKFIRILIIINRFIVI